MSIPLNAGWNWISANLDFTASEGEIAQCVSAAEPWSAKDMIKNPSTRKFVSYDADKNAFVGSLESPVVLTPNAYVGPYKLIENDHVVIIRNNEKYDVTGKKL